MENLVFESTAQQLTEADIKEFETLLNIKLPQDFKQHYLQNNGGIPNANWSAGEEINYPFEKFLSIKYGNDKIEDKIQEFNNQSFDFGERLLFATKGRHYIFYIDVGTKNHGQIFVMRIKLGDIKNARWEYHCASFTEFLDGLNQIIVKK